MDKRNVEKTKIDLLNAAEKLMTGCDDPNLVTSRAIAKEAGVNAAMINYCYGSREALLFAVFNRIQQEGQVSNPAFIKILGDNLTPKEKLIEIHIESMKMMLKHFNYAKAITNMKNISVCDFDFLIFSSIELVYNSCNNISFTALNKLHKMLSTCGFCR